MSDLVKLIDNVPLASTIDIAEGMRLEHRAVLFLVQKYESEFQEIRTFAAALRKSGGRPITYYWLDEEQALYLVTLMKNSDIVRSFKRKLAHDFLAMRRMLSDLASQRQNAQWLETRNTGKQKRRVETDTIQRFVAYAVAQGSKNAERYYANISKMQNKALFFVEQKFKNIREILNLQQLSIVICADEIVTKALDDGMAKEMPYKDIYQLAKTRIESFAEIHGKTLIPAGLKQITANAGYPDDAAVREDQVLAGLRISGHL